ncbi:MAG: Uma2 family endonuclease [Acidobacteria bacterium]|nr:Uma2 family endonuclease [Acidobacteriota bacterium]
MTWEQVLANPFLQNLPFKIELISFGQVLMSPVSNQHKIIQSDVGYELRRHKYNGRVINGCSIRTSDGVRVADIAWASEDFLAVYGEQTPYPQAPEICVEIVSPSNAKLEVKNRIELYLEQGALEVWIVNSKKQVSFFSRHGKLSKSKLLPKLKLLPE